MNQYALEALLYTPDFGEDSYIFNSSSSSDSEDEQCVCQDESQSPVKKSKTEGFVEMEVTVLNEYDFKNSFRVNRTTCEKVLEMLYDNFSTEHKGGRERISAEKATYMLLWYLGNQETFKQMAARFKNTMSSVHCVLQKATKILSTKLQDQIVWPSETEYPTISQMFEELSNLKGCIGVLGVSYIKIPKPKEESANYLCCKNYPSLALQGVVTINGKFLDIYINEGSNDAEKLLQKSNLVIEAENNLLGDYYLVGFNNYLNRQWLVQPFEDSSITEMHSFFNTCHDAAVNLFPESLGYLKGRFQRLQNFENRDIIIVSQCIESACMIHNLAIDCEDENNEFFVTDPGIFENTLMNLTGEEQYGVRSRRQKAFEELVKSDKHELRNT